MARRRKVRPAAVTAPTATVNVQGAPVTVRISGESVLTPITTSGGTALWACDFESGNLLDYMQNLTYNYEPTAAAVVGTPTRAGSYAAAFTIPAYGLRCEVEPDAAGSYNGGMERWFYMSTRYSGVNMATDAWQNIGVQWQTTLFTSPPLQLGLRNGVPWVGGGWGHPGGTSYDAWQNCGGVITNDTWYDWVFKVIFSSNPAVGEVTVWRDGTKVVDAWKPPGGTMYPDSTSYVKYGYYRSDTISTSGTVYLDSLTIADGAL